MIYEVTNSKSEINFAPSTEAAEIIQNIRTLLQTVKGSCPLFREFGINSELLDVPINEITKARLIAEIVEQIRQYEKRCNVKRCEVSGDCLTGSIKICVYVDL